MLTNRMKHQCVFLLYVVLILAISKVSECKIKLENEVKELEKVLELKNRHIDLYEKTLAISDSSNAAVINELMKQIEFNQNVINELLKNANTTTYTDDQLQEYEDKLKKQNEIISERDQQMSKLKIERKTCEQTMEKYDAKLVKSCVPYQDSPGVHQLSLSAYLTFDVLCANVINRRGWTVIQQRIDGKEDFNRNWATYKNGFGSFDGDFFLGLEKIHRLTMDQPHELFVNLTTYGGRFSWLIYDHFAIAGEAEQYKIITLESNHNHTGLLQEYDFFSRHKFSNFSTFDRDNDRNENKNCAEIHNTGWWYGNCQYW